MQAVAGSQFLILQLLLHFRFSSLHMSQFCACDSSSCLCSNTSKNGHFCFAAWPKRPKDHSGCVHHDNITALLQCNSPKHPYVDVVSSDYRVYGNNDSTLDSTSHAIACDDFTRSRSLVMDYFVDIIVADITAGQRNGCFTEIGPHRQNQLYGM